ncbi:MAG TPA: helix-turn-helix transcriptional regulator [Sphingomonas sp.]|jgi:transcriptional regulator with XRE-family HTH domain
MLDREKIEVRRQALGLSQEEAANKAGLAGRQVWNNIVSGRKANVTMETLNKIANALDCHPRDLILADQPQAM